MTLIELQPGTAVDPTKVIAIYRTDHKEEGTRGPDRKTIIETAISCVDGRALRVRVDYDEVLALLNMTEEDPPKTGPTPYADPDADPRPHSRACGIRSHKHGTGCSRDCPTCHGRTAAP